MTLSNGALKVGLNHIFAHFMNNVGRENNGDFGIPCLQSLEFEVILFQVLILNEIV